MNCLTTVHASFNVGKTLLWKPKTSSRVTGIASTHFLPAEDCSQASRERQQLHKCHSQRRHSSVLDQEVEAVVAQDAQGHCLLHRHRQPDRSASAPDTGRQYTVSGDRMVPRTSHSPRRVSSFCQHMLQSQRDETFTVLKLSSTTITQRQSVNSSHMSQIDKWMSWHNLCYTIWQETNQKGLRQGTHKQNMKTACPPHDNSLSLNTFEQRSKRIFFRQCQWRIPSLLSWHFL